MPLMLQHSRNGVLQPIDFPLHAYLTAITAQDEGRDEPTHGIPDLYAFEDIIHITCRDGSVLHIQPGDELRFWWQ
jgi:hypothetical protein